VHGRSAADSRSKRAPSSSFLLPWTEGKNPWQNPLAKLQGPDVTETRVQVRYCRISSGEASNFFIVWALLPAFKMLMKSTFK